MPKRLRSVEPEPPQAAPQVNHCTGAPERGAKRRHTALVEQLRHRIARLDAFALQRPARAGMLRAKASDRARVAAAPCSRASLVSHIISPPTARGAGCRWPRSGRSRVRDVSPCEIWCLELG
jgi:hypothetical protein